MEKKPIVIVGAGMAVSALHLEHAQIGTPIVIKKEQEDFVEAWRKEMQEKGQIYTDQDIEEIKRIVFSRPDVEKNLDILSLRESFPELHERKVFTEEKKSTILSRFSKKLKDRKQKAIDEESLTIEEIKTLDSIRSEPYYSSAESNRKPKKKKRKKR